MFKQRLLCSSVAAVTALGGLQAARAQDAELVEEIVVTGVRASLEKGIEIKREKMQVVDSIVAEDIGKFPDNNVVEALQRVTGVQVTDRGAGEVNKVSIRGLDDVTIIVNGRQLFTASGRAIALADIPASLLKGVDVYKTRSSEQISSGIAGQIDVHTQRPFDFDGTRTVLAGRGIYQEQAESTDPNLSGLFSTRWETSAGEFGALVNVSYAETNYRDQSITPGAAVPFVTADAPEGWAPYERIFLEDGRVAENPIWMPGLEQGLPFAPGSTVTMNGEQVEYVLGRDAIFASDFTGKRERPAANISLQWAPNDNSEYLFEAFYNGYRNDSFNSLMFTFVDWWGDNTHLPRGGEVELYEGTNIVRKRDVAAPYGFNSGDLTTAKTDSYVYALGGKWDISDSFRLESELYYQKSEFEQQFMAMRTERVAYGLGVDFNSGGGLPSLEFYDDPATEIDESDLTDPALWTVAQMYDSGLSREGDSWTFTIDGDLDVEFGWINTLSFGLRYEDRGASESSTPGYEGFLGRPLTEFDPGLVHISEDFFDGRTNIPSEWAVVDGYYLKKHAAEFRDLYNWDEVYGSAAPQLSRNFQIEDEKTAALYVQADFAGDLFGRELDGQFGFRYVSTDRNMTFWDLEADPLSDGSFPKNSGAGDNAKVLPSLMVRYHLTDDLMARFAYTQTLRQPDFVALNPSITYVEDVTNIGYGTASGGNPDLEPTESTNLDLTLEWYFGDASAVYGTLFRRDVEGFVYSSRRIITHEDYRYILSQPGNSSDGILEGLEFGVVYFPENLPNLLDGFGIQASYTALDASQKVTQYNGQGEAIGMLEVPVFQVSDSSYSVVLAYDKDALDMRLSYVWRDDFLNNLEAAQFANPLGVYRKAETSMDFQASYDVMENLVVTFDAANLLDEEYQSYYEYPDVYNFGNSIYSRTFALGARYSF